jgi:hypothetical protein
MSTSRWLVVRVAALALAATATEAFLAPTPVLRSPALAGRATVTGRPLSLRMVRLRDSYDSGDRRCMC